MLIVVHRGIDWYNCVWSLYFTVLRTVFIWFDSVCSGWSFFFRGTMDRVSCVREWFRIFCWLLQDILHAETWNNYRINKVCSWNTCTGRMCGYRYSRLDLFQDIFKNWFCVIGQKIGFDFFSKNYVRRMLPFSRIILSFSLETEILPIFEILKKY